MRVHADNHPSKAFKGKSDSKYQYKDNVVEVDALTGRMVKALEEAGVADNTFVFFTSDNGPQNDAWPDGGYTPFRGTKGTDREGGSRVPALAWWPDTIKAGSDSHEIVGGLDMLATFTTIAGVPLPEKDREGKPIVFDSYDMMPLLTGKEG